MKQATRKQADQRPANDETAIRALLRTYENGIRNKDADTVVACYAPDVTGYDLAPPLAFDSDAMRSTAGLREWFGTWKTPIGAEGHDLTIRANGNLGYAYALRHMTGTKVDGEHVDLWFRATAAFEKRDGTWRITHIHNSVPFAMDGSGKALLDLKP